MCENLWIKLPNWNLIIAVIYRHPSTKTTEFIEALDFNLTKLSSNTYYILGDININVSDEVQSSSKSDYVNMLAANNTHQLITKLTRVTDGSKSLLDHILTNDCKNPITPGVILNDLSDHFPIFCSISKNASHKYPPAYYRDLKHFNSEQLLHEDLFNNLSSFIVNLPTITHENFNDAFELSTTIIKFTIDKHAPLRKLSRKMRKLKQKQWITKDIITKAFNFNSFPIWFLQ